MFHSAKRLEQLRLTACAALALAIVVTSGCASHERPRPAPSQADTRPAPPTASPDEKIVDEELVGPPGPAPQDFEGPPEPVGPPAPVVREQRVPPPAVAPEPQREARASEFDAALIGELAAVGADVHPSARGPVVILPDTIFELGTATLYRDAKRKIHEIGRIVSERAFRSRVAVEGHSDSTGAEMYNRGLSDRRANAIAAELGSAGVAKKNLTAKGYGSEFPIAPNAHADGSDDPQGRARNRRVEIVIETAASPGA